MSKPICLRAIAFNNMSLALSCLAFVASLCSCQKDLVYLVDADRRIDLSFTWNDVEKKDFMDVWVFPSVGSGLFYSVPADKVSTVDVPKGCLRTFCYNNDNDINQFEISTWEESVVTTGNTELLTKAVFGDNEQGIPRGGDVDEPVRFQPSELYCDTCSTIADGQSLILFAPKSPLTEIDVIVKSVKGFEGVKYASAALSGMAGSLSLSTLKPTGVACTIPMEMTVNADATISGKSLSFGRLENFAGKNVLTIYVLLSDGQKIYYTYDVSERMEQSAENAKIVLIIEEMKIPEVQANGGFNPQLDAWNTIEEEIAM